MRRRRRLGSHRTSDVICHFDYPNGPHGDHIRQQYASVCRLTPKSRSAPASGRVSVHHAKRTSASVLILKRAQVCSS